MPNLIGDSREEETFCVDTKHLRLGGVGGQDIRTQAFVFVNVKL